MTKNDVLKSLRDTFNYDDSKMIAIFALANHEVDRMHVCEWLKDVNDSDYKFLKDIDLSCFLDGLIIEKRGKKEGPQPPPERKMNNNIILKKLKIAMDFKNDDVLEVLKLANFELSNHELTSLFRKPKHKNFRKCKDQILRNFLKGLQAKLRLDPLEG